MKKYFTLLTLQNGKYYAQFGDYSSQVVKEEQQDSYSDYKCKIIKTDDSQKAIDYRIAQLNAEMNKIIN